MRRACHGLCGADVQAEELVKPVERSFRFGEERRGVEGSYAIRGGGQQPHIGVHQPHPDQRDAAGIAQLEIGEQVLPTDDPQVHLRPDLHVAGVLAPVGVAQHSDQEAAQLVI